MIWSWDWFFFRRRVHKKLQKIKSFNSRSTHTKLFEILIAISIFICIVSVEQVLTICLQFVAKYLARFYFVSVTHTHTHAHTLAIFQIEFSLLFVFLNFNMKREYTERWNEYDGVRYISIVMELRIQNKTKQKPNNRTIHHTCQEINVRESYEYVCFVFVFVFACMHHVRKHTYMCIYM